MRDRGDRTAEGGARVRWKSKRDKRTRVYACVRDNGA